MRLDPGPDPLQLHDPTGPDGADAAPPAESGEAPAAAGDSSDPCICGNPDRDHLLRDALTIHRGAPPTRPETPAPPIVSSGLVPVRLETERGELVIEGAIPPFLTIPPVLTWGLRTFRLHEEAATAMVYRECFAVALVVGSDLQPLPPGAGAIEDSVRFPPTGWIADKDLVRAFLVKLKGERSPIVHAHNVFRSKDGKEYDANPLAFFSPDELRGAAQAMWRLAMSWERLRAEQEPTSTAAEAAT